MTNAADVFISAAVEGDVDEAVVRRIIQHVGARPGPVHGKNGKRSLRRDIAGYKNAARHAPWVVLVDLNHEADCAPPLCAEWVGSPVAYLCFRVAVREVESWLMADREKLSRFLGVPRAAIPQDPETIENPKEFTVSLARRSRFRDIRQDMVPRAGSGRVVGPAYTSRLIEFVTTTAHGWRPDAGARCSDSLGRCIQCLERIIESWRRHIGGGGGPRD